MIASSALVFPLDANSLRSAGWSAQLLRRFALSNALQRCSHDGAMFAPESYWDLRPTLDLPTLEEV
jgi:hypothetical protein